MNKKILICSVIVILVVGCYFLIHEKTVHIEESFKQYQGEKIINENKNAFTWKSFPIENVWGIINTDKNIFFTPDSLEFYQEMNLVNGATAAIFKGDDGSDEGAKVLLVRDSQNNISIGKFQSLENEISPIYLNTQVRLNYIADYKFLNEENGFYTVYKMRTGSSESSNFLCTSDSVKAYQWSPKTSLFEYNTALTVKYTAIECK